ncbi:MAG TPA: ABC transporter substrate-binding protein [Ilumatobacter sp.]|nr:ABC transporter substrate-binding protein [Ilumatobacter sp.]
MRTNYRHRGAQRLAASAVVAALAVAACGGNDDDSTDNTPPATQAPATPGDTSAPSPTDATPPPATDKPDTGGPVVVTVAPNTSPPEAEAVRGGTVRFAIEADVDGLNPTSSQLTAAPGLVMAAAVFDKLAELTPTGAPVPVLAESFTPNADNTSWEVALKQGISFHDGTPFNAEAVRVNFEAQYENTLVGLAVKPFYPETGAIEVVDEFTVRFNLLEPNAQWPAYMASQLGMVASPTWLAAAIADPTLNQRPVGTGPFAFDSRSEDSVTRFVRNDDYWNGEVYLDAIEFLPVPDSATRAELLINGAVDALHTSEPGAIRDLRAADGITRMENDSGDETFIMLNTHVPPFDDIRARQALTYATPRTEYLTLIGLGVVRQADQMFTPESPYYNPDITQEGDDPDRAVALAAEYCAERGGETNPVTNQPTCTNGKINIELQWSGPDVVQTRIADMLQSAFSPAFNVTRDELLQDTHILQVVTSGYNVSTWRQLGALNPMTDNVWLMCRTAPDEGLALNFPRLCDPDRDAALLAAQATTDETERAAHYREVVRLMHDSYAYVFLTHTMWVTAFDESVQGICDRTAPDGTSLACAIGGTTWHHTLWLDR